MSNTKRTSNQIQAEIARLQGELADIREEELKMASAVHILENLGWTRRAGKWERPISIRPHHGGRSNLPKGSLVVHNNLLYVVSQDAAKPLNIWVREVLSVESDNTMVTMPFSIEVDRLDVYPTTSAQWAGYKKF